MTFFLQFNLFLLPLNHGQRKKKRNHNSSDGANSPPLFLFVPEPLHTFDQDELKNSSAGLNGNFLFGKDMKSMLENRRSFRKKLINRRTIAEKLLENYLISVGFKFESQKIISPYIADFLILDRGLIIELDGSIHQTNRVKEKDYRRDDYFMSMKFFVLHFNNNVSPEIIYKEIQKFPILNPSWKKNMLRMHIAKVNGMANNKGFSNLMFSSSNYKEMKEIWKLYKQKPV